MTTAAAPRAVAVVVPEAAVADPARGALAPVASLTDGQVVGPMDVRVAVQGVKGMSTAAATERVATTGPSRTVHR